MCDRIKGCCIGDFEKKKNKKTVEKTNVDESSLLDGVHPQFLKVTQRWDLEMEDQCRWAFKTGTFLGLHLRFAREVPGNSGETPLS